MNIKAGQTVQIYYWDSSRLYEKFAAIKVECVGQAHVTGRRINRDEEYVEIRIKDIRSFQVIAQPGEHAMHTSKLSSNGSEWYKWQNIYEEAERRFRETYPHLQFIRIDEESFYVIYMTKAEKNNRLWGHTCYLAGPIDRCPDGGKSWRDWITPELNRRGIIAVDPLQKPVDSALEGDDSRKVRGNWKEQGEFEKFAANMKLIRHVDMHIMDLSSFHIVKLDASLHMCGTYEELFWANRQKKPILVWCPQGVKKIPDWLWGVLPHEFFFDSMESLLKYLDEIDSGEEKPDDLNRWLFMDYKKLYGQIIPL